jgi:hypothetical protein
VAAQPNVPPPAGRLPQVVAAPVSESVSWERLIAVGDQIAAYHRDYPPVDRITVHDSPTLVHILDETVPQRAVPFHFAQNGSMLFATPVHFDVDVPPDRLRFTHADGRVFDHMVDGRVVRVVP